LLVSLALGLLGLGLGLPSLLPLLGLLLRLGLSLLGAALCFLDPDVAVLILSVSLDPENFEKATEAGAD
jgi:hypothetical protein